MSILRNLFLLVVLVLVCAPVSAEEYHYQWNPNPADCSAPHCYNDAGNATEVSAVFDDATNQFQFSVTFEENGGVIPEALILILNNGPMPAGPFPGEYAAIYFDATQAYAGTGDPIVTVYGYNGVGYPRSYVDGDGSTGAWEEADKIASSLVNDSFVNSTSATTNPDGTRTMSFNLDASGINSHSPVYPHPVNSWYGVGFDMSAGIWLMGFGGPAPGPYGLPSEVNYDVDGYLLQDQVGDGDECSYGWRFDLSTVYDYADQCTEEDESGAECGPKDCLGVINGTARWDDYEVCCPEGEIDECGVCYGDNTSCLGCEGYDISNTQILMDGGGHAQARLVKKAARKLRRISSLTKDKKFAKNSIKQAKALAIENWQLTYTLPGIINQCENDILCVNIDNTPVTSAYDYNALQLRTLGLKNLRRVRRRGGGVNKRLRNKIKSLYEDNIALSSTIPTTTSACD